MSVVIIRRETKKGPRWHVRYQAHRRSKIVHLGSFESETLAKIRRQAALETVARGGTPAREAPPVEEAPVLTVGAAAEAWLATLHDLAPSSLRGYQHSVRVLPDWLASMDVSAVTRAHAQAHATELGARYKRSTAEKEMRVLRMTLDFADVQPNPARDRRIRLPRAERRVYRLPTRAQIAAMHAAMPSRVPLMLLLEHTGLRVSEAAALRWRDVDHARGRLLVRESKTNAGRRWVEHLPASPVFPRRPEGADLDRLIFDHPSPSSLTGMLRVSHLRHGTFLMSAHEFRHLHASRLLHDGILSPAQIAARLGHANPGITLAVYAHLAPPSD